MLRKMRPVLIVIGLGVAIGSLVGARALTHGTDATAKSVETNAKSATGLVVMGDVATDSPQVSYGLPPVLQSGTIAKVYVKDGDEVKVDQPLYEFDATTLSTRLAVAKASVAVFEAKVGEAKELVKQHEEQVKNADLAVTFAERRVKLAELYHTWVEKKLEKSYEFDQKPRSEWDELKKSSLELYQAKVAYNTVLSELDTTKLKRDSLKLVDPQVKVKEAEAAVKQAKAEEDAAQSAVNLCTVKAKSAGTIEQVTIGPGSTLGVSTRTPALLLIPDGQRIVRAEVESEFAHRIGPDIQGKTVTIFDHNDPKLTYSGTVRRPSTTFLAKRTNADSFLGSDTRVLEIIIDVTDPKPPGKPQLFVGKRVRVNLGQ